jgi:hypothetical protein
MLEEGDMYGGVEQDLDRLPPNEATKGKRGNRWRRVVVRSRLEGVLAADIAPYIRDTVVGDLEEEAWQS